MNEIVSTEERYLEQLESMNKNYWERLKDSYPNQINELFETLDLESMIKLSNTLLLQLRERKKTWNSNTTQIGSIFHATAPFFKIYIDYAMAYDLKLKSLENDMQSNQEFAKAINEGTALDKYDLDIFSLLITPIQRIPRYELLLKDLIKNTPTEHIDFANLEKAKNEMQEVNKLINTRVGETAHSVKILQNEQLSKYIAPYRRLLESNDVQLRIEKVKRKAAMYIFNDILVFIFKEQVKKKIPGVGSYYYNEICWPCELLWITDMKGSPQFELIGPDSIAMWVTPDKIENKEKIFTQIEQLHNTAIKEKNLCKITFFFIFYLFNFVSMPQSVGKKRSLQLPLGWKL